MDKHSLKPHCSVFSLSSLCFPGGNDLNDSVATRGRQLFEIPETDYDIKVIRFSYHYLKGINTRWLENGKDTSPYPPQPHKHTKMSLKPLHTKANYYCYIYLLTEHETALPWHQIFIIPSQQRPLCWDDRHYKKLCALTPNLNFNFKKCGSGSTGPVKMASISWSVSHRAHVDLHVGLVG